jgi:predicted metal-dependent peptidase
MKEYMRKYGVRGEYVPQSLHLIINVVLDSKANQYNMIQVNTYNLKPITLSDISRLLEYKYDVSELEKMSSEEILELLLKKYSQQVISISSSRCFIDVKENKPSKSVQIQKSSDEKEQEEKEKGMGEQENEQELEKKLTKKVLQAYTVAKSIGTLPGNIEELIENLLKPQVNWKVLLRNAITKGIGKNVKRTWTRPSRKYELFPGKEFLKINKVIVLMDVSGSISKEELQQFALEIYSIVKETSDVIVILWDADVQGEFILKRTSDVKKIKVTGRGGTLILPALHYAIKKYTGLYVILSDWEIGDLYNSSVKQLLQKVKPICITTHTIPKIEGLEKNFIKIKI